MATIVMSRIRALFAKKMQIFIVIVLLSFTPCFVANAVLPTKFENNVPVKTLWPEVSNIHEAFDYAVRPYLEDSAKEWFQLSSPLPAGSIDPGYVMLAKLLGGYVVLGGSDLIETVAYGGPKMASPSEVNVVYPKDWMTSSAVIEQSYRTLMIEKAGKGGLLQRIRENKTDSKKNMPLAFTVEFPRYQKREKSVLQRLYINAEPSRDLKRFVVNRANGKFLTDGSDYLSVPVKHGYFAIISGNGEGLVYFRTAMDKKRYLRKVLVLPDEDDFNEKHPMRVDNPLKRGQLLTIILYNLSVYARALQHGWRFSKTSKDIIQGWITGLKLAKEEMLVYFNPYKNKIPAHLDFFGGDQSIQHRNNLWNTLWRQGVSDQYILETTDYFGLTDPATKYAVPLLKGKEDSPVLAPAAMPDSDEVALRNFNAHP